MYDVGQQVIEKINDEKNFLRGAVEKWTACVSGLDAITEYSKQIQIYINLEERI